jgi:hypothetical protein
MTPVSGLRVLRHPRPGTAEVSLRHVSGWLIGGCGSSNLTVTNAVPQRFERTARYPPPTDPGVCQRALALVPDGWDSLSVRQGFCSFAREAWPLARTHVRHVFPLKGGLARDPRGLLMA